MTERDHEAGQIGVSEAICGILVNDEGKILLAKRADKRTYSPGLHDLMGGDIPFGKTPLRTLVSDAEEKFNIRLGAKDSIKRLCVKDMEYPSRTISTVIFLWHLNSTPPIELDYKKYAESNWYDPSEIDQLSTTPKVKEVLAMAGLLK